MEYHSNMISFSRSQPETFTAVPTNSRKPSGETLDFQFGQNVGNNSEALDFHFGQNMENNSETPKETFNSETQSDLFDESFFNLNATPSTTKHPENSMHKTDNPVDDGDLQTPTTVAKKAKKSPAKSKSSKKPKKSPAKSKSSKKSRSKLKVGLVEGPDIPEWLPQGWQLERRKRANGINAGMIETFYYDPEKGRQFKSKNEVLLFLESGTRGKGKSAQRRPKEIVAEPTNNFNIPTQASTSKSCIDRHPELAPHVSSIDPNGSGNLNPVIGNEPVPKQTMDDQNAVRRSGAVGTSLKLGIIEGVDLPEWLPQGWKMERKVRQSGASAGTIDVVYISPEKGCKFWSKVGVLRYLETGMGQIHPKRAKPSNNLKPSTRRRPSSKRRKKIASTTNITDQPELGSRVQNLDADGFGSLNPLVGDEPVAEQTMHGWDADFTITEVRTSFQS